MRNFVAVGWRWMESAIGKGYFQVEWVIGNMSDGTED